MNLNFILQINKGITPTNKTDKSGNREPISKRSIQRRKGVKSQKQTNFRSNRFHKPMKKIKSSSRIGSLRRPQDGINSGIANITNKNSKRYGSMPKGLMKNRSTKFYKINNNQLQTNNKTSFLN